MTRSFLSIFLTVCFAVFLSPTHANAKCALQRIKGEEKTLSSSTLNQVLLDTVILAQVNYYRCKHGRSKLAAASGLRRQASKHSIWMAKTGKLSHKATNGASRTLTQRLKASGLRFKTGAENIGVVRLYNIDGRRFLIRSASKCQFTTQSGQTLGRHSYRSLAQLAVKEWIESPSHRKNIMLRKATHMGSGGGIQPKSQYCGAVFLTQIFLGQ